MKYTIPYSDKISLPRIKEVLEINIASEDISYDQTELEGKIIISGEYTVTNDSEVMEFTHEIPISFLIDDPDVNPSVDVNNFTYDVIAGKGLEVNFELDVLILEHEEKPEKADVQVEAKDQEEFQESVNSKLNEFLSDRGDSKKVVTTDEEDTDEKKDEKEELKEEEELIVNEREVQEEQCDDLDGESADELSDELSRDGESDDQRVIDALDDSLEQDDEMIDSVDVEVELEDVNEEYDEPAESECEEGEQELIDELATEGGRINIRPSSNMSSSESYYNSLRESYSTYKVYFLDEGQSIDEFCVENDVSRALIDDEDTELTRKVVIRVDHE